MDKVNRDVRDGFKYTPPNFYIAALFQYLGYRCILVDDNARPTTFTFLLPNEAHSTELLDAWNSTEGQPLSNAKAYADALLKLNDLSKRARMNEFRVWESPEYLAGK